ncbi:MAG: electron transfer flavoprotein-ubiquinone oxidoreductase [Planctomycetota bacterium]
MERETLPVDILFVGAGPANLAGAYHLARSLKELGKDDVEIAVIEKGQSVGSHTLSGAVMDPRALAELFPDGWQEAGCPVEAEVTGEKVLLLSEHKARSLPIPPFLKNHGYHIVTLSDIVVWLKDKLEELEVMVFEGFPGNELIMDGDKVRGVRTMDKGLNADGEPGPAFEPGADIEAKVTVLGEGVRGSLTKALVDSNNLHGPNPQIYGTGCKELWQLPDGRFPAGQVFHTAGWPLPSEEYGGSWIYGLPNNRVSIGFVTALDGGKPWLDPWETFQRWKTHPKIREILEGGEILKAGAKVVPEGGYWSRPKSFGDGFLIVGDSASLLNISRLKGIHSAIKSGMMASDTILEAIEKDDFSSATLQRYEDRFQDSWLRDELYRVRNFRQEFQQSGFWGGGLKAGFKYVLGGIGKERIDTHPDHKEMKKLSAAGQRPAPLEYDGKYLIDKVTGVYHAGSIHNEHQPTHLHVADPNICATKCAEEYGNPCESFCPASVYEMVPDDAGGKRLQINFSNCVHCKTCDIMDPYEIITWTVPSDAGGPKYQGL